MTNKIIFIIITACWFINPISAQFNCDLNPEDYESNASLVMELFFDGIASDNPLDIIIAVDMSGNCRGVSTGSDYGLGYIAQEMMVYGNMTGELITFQAYDYSEEQVYETVLENYIFSANDIKGTFSEPWIFHAECEDSDDDSICNNSDDCIGTYDDCNICSGDNSTCTGCTDQNATNFDPDATVDDGSCILAIDSPEIPDIYSLVAYPNPFNPVSAISFTIPKMGLVTLGVYNLLGKELEILLNKNLSMGRYTITWNASSYSSGFYLIRMASYDRTSGLQIDNRFLVTQQLLLIK